MTSPDPEVDARVLAAFGIPPHIMGPDNSIKDPELAALWRLYNAVGSTPEDRRWLERLVRERLDKLQRPLDPDAAGYVTVHDSGSTTMKHLGGVPWHEAPLPPRVHRCWAQTDGRINYFEQVQRCACGGIRTSAVKGSDWFERNSRRKDRDPYEPMYRLEPPEPPYWFFTRAGETWVSPHDWTWLWWAPWRCRLCYMPRWAHPTGGRLHARSSAHRGVQDLDFSDVSQ